MHKLLFRRRWTLFVQRGMVVLFSFLVPMRVVQEVRKLRRAHDGGRAGGALGPQLFLNIAKADAQPREGPVPAEGGPPANLLLLRTLCDGLREQLCTKSSAQLRLRQAGGLGLHPELLREVLEFNCQSCTLIQPAAIQGVLVFDKAPQHLLPPCIPGKRPRVGAARGCSCWRPGRLQRWLFGLAGYCGSRGQGWVAAGLRLVQVGGRCRPAASRTGLQRHLL
mmetsp:Transcript_85089/g.258205  ORF Transcript_85089/g.258205 Transcript_85089/m.258205 type:complete len:222 (-) Transcript_85089:177-842(-)